MVVAAGLMAKKGYIYPSTAAKAAEQVEARSLELYERLAVVGKCTP